MWFVFLFFVVVKANFDSVYRRRGKKNIQLLSAYSTNIVNGINEKHAIFQLIYIFTNFFFFFFLV